MVGTIWKALAPVAVAAAIALLPAPAGLPPHAWYFFALFAGVIVGLMFEPLPGGAIGLIGVTLMLFHLGNDNQEIIATLSVFAVALTRMKGAMRGLMDCFTEVRHNAASLDIVYEGLRTLEPLIDDAPRTPAPLPFRDTIELEHLAYRYPGAPQDSLQDITLTIRHGEAIGIVGTSGGSEAGAQPDGFDHRKGLYAGDVGVGAVSRLCADGARCAAELN